MAGSAVGNVPRRRSPCPNWPSCPGPQEGRAGAPASISDRAPRAHSPARGAVLLIYAAGSRIKCALLAKHCGCGFLQAAFSSARTPIENARSLSCATTVEGAQIKNINRLGRSLLIHAQRSCQRAARAAMQADVLEATLDLFYTQSAGEGGGAPAAYSRTDPRRTLMLHYALATALLLEDCDLQPAQVPLSLAICAGGCAAYSPPCL